MKQRLQKHFHSKLSFLHRPGLSDLICSSKLTVHDALSKAAQLQTEVLQPDDDLESAETCGINMDTMDEMLILHRAAGILRKAMTDIEVSANSYVSTAGFEIEQ